MFNAPVTAYSKAMPVSPRKAAIVLVTAKLKLPWRGAGSWVLRPHRANAAVLISSKKTNRLNRSPVSTKPSMAARKTSISG